MSRFVRALSALTVLSLLSACPGAGDLLSQFDRNNNGVIDPEDLDDGEAVALFTSVLPGDENEGPVTEEIALSTVTVELSEGGSGGWYLNVAFDDEAGSDLSLRFMNESPMVVGRGAVTNANMSRAVGEGWYAYTSETAAEVEITGVGETVAGFLDGQVVMEVLGEFEQPTGETVTISGFAFRGVAITPS